METAVIGDTAPGSRRSDWLRRIVLIAALVFVLLLSYVLVATLLSGGEDEPPPENVDDGVEDDGMTALGAAPGDRPVAVFGLGADDVEHVDDLLVGLLCAGHRQLLGRWFVG